MKKEGKRKALSALVCGSMLTVALVGGTLAYLTDEAGAQHNVFSVGNLSIALDEKVGVFGEGGEVEELEAGAKYTGIMPGDFLQKEVTVSNNGKTDAYVAVTVTLSNDNNDFALLLNQAIDDAYGDADAQAVYDEIFAGWGLKHGKDLDGDGVNDAGMRLTISGDDMPEHVIQVDSVKTIDEYAQFYSKNWFGDDEDIVPFDEYYTDGMGKYEFKYTYYAYLPANKSTTLFDGLNVPAYFNAEQLKTFDGLKIDVSAKAIQADNMGIAEEYANDPDGEAKTAFAVLAGIIEAEDLDVNNNPVKGYKVSNDEELAAAIQNDETEIWLKPGTYHAPAAAKGKTLTINGTKDAVLEVVPAGQGEANGQLDYSFDGSTVTFNGITIKTNSQTYAGYARLSGTYNDCVIQNTYNLGTGNSAFNNCTLNITNEYLRVGGAYSATFDGCTFNTDGRAILVFQDGTSVAQTVTVKDCTFNATAAANTWNGIHVAAVSIDGTNGTYVVNLQGTNTVDSDFNGLWQIKAGKTNVTVNE